MATFSVSATPVDIAYTGVAENLVVLTDPEVRHRRGEKVLKITQVSGSCKVGSIGIVAESSALATGESVTVSTWHKEELFYFEGVTDGTIRVELV